eukprot:gene9533-12473_t
MDDEYTSLVQMGVTKPGGIACLSFDQNLLDNALQSTICKTMTFISALNACLNDTLPAWHAASGSNVSKQEAMQNQEKHLSCHLRMTSKHDDVPETRSCVFKPERGGRYYSSSGGQFSGAFYQQLQEDCPGCKWWPETSSAEDLDLSEKQTEKFSFAPYWQAKSALFTNDGLVWPADGSPARTHRGPTAATKVASSAYSMPCLYTKAAPGDTPTALVPQLTLETLSSTPC